MSRGVLLHLSFLISFLYNINRANTYLVFVMWCYNLGMDKGKVIFLTICFLSFAVLFVWFAVRPSYIKHNCSWVKKHADYIPAIPAMTKEELVSKGIIRSCDTEIANLKKVMPTANYQLGDNNVHAQLMTRVTDVNFRGMSNDPLWEATSCIEDGNKIINDYKNPRPEVPEKTWYEKAGLQEYSFCLHDMGL